MIDELATLARKEGGEQVVIGMAHRGRLSVLAHNLGRSLESIMAEFEGAKALDAVKRTDALRHGGTGDVKYHHGAEGLFESTEGDVRMRLYPNPTHLEFVDPVVTGGARAAQTAHSGPQIAPRRERRGAAAAARRRGVPGPGSRRRDAQPAVARAATRPAARSTSSRTTRWASRPIRRRVARPRTPPTWRRASTSRSSTSTPTTPENCIAAIRLAMAYRAKFAPRRRHRPDRLPPLRPQRDRRARLHPARAGGADQEAPADQRALRRAG